MLSWLYNMSVLFSM